MKSELEFLPAALEIQETPPLPVSRYILYSIMLFFSIAVVWANVGEVDIVGVAQGKIVPTGRVKIIQPLETGVVRNIFIKEGDQVAEGEALIELDTTLTGADREQVVEQQLTLKLDRERLYHIIETVNDRQPTEVTVSKATDAQIKLQQDRIKIQLDEYYARKQALSDEKDQRHAERKSIKERIAQLDATVPLITERAKSLHDLLKDNMVPRVQWLELEQERIEQVKERDVQRSNLNSLDSSIANITQREAAQKAEFEKQILTELADVENRLSAFEQELVKADKRVTLQTLTAPVAGTIHRLSTHTIGGVVTPAQELMHIVPEEDAIEVEAWLQNKDIGFVNKGQEAEIKIETFPFTKYGTIDGEIATLSNDATPDERLGLVYATRVKMEKTTMQVKDKIINLSPGMAVTVELNMGKRKLIEYLLSPLLRYKDESVRER
ncbi:MAG: HlyD family type I secretion periplasmic adaptor subunit [Gammaproteobacteria bacterium]|nr:HlyD family type I secretion periplasmic adaptor subunit [Gammaproteobacteria bacterium]